MLNSNCQTQANKLYLNQLVRVKPIRKSKTHSCYHFSVSNFPADHKIPRFIIIDASGASKSFATINTGIYCFDKTFLEEAIGLIRPDNNQAEFYLTDMVQIARSKREKISVRLMADSRQVIGVNSPNDLERVEALIQQIENELS